MTDVPPAGKSAGQLALHRERIRVFLAAVQAGASNRSAAAEAGIGLATIHRWTHGERPWDGVMRSRLSRARAIRERRWVSMIEAAANTPLNSGAPGDWRAAAWLAERTNPADWGQVSKTEITGAGGGAVRVAQSVEHVLAVPDVERLQRVMELMVQAGKVPQLTGGNGNGHVPEDASVE